MCVPFVRRKKKGKAKQKPEADVVVVVLCLCFAHFMKWLLSSSGSPNIPFHACFMHHPQTKQIHFISQANKAKQSNAQAQPALYLLPMFSDSAASSMCKIKHRFKYLSPSCLLAFHVILGFFYSWDFHSLHSKRGKKKKIEFVKKVAAVKHIKIHMKIQGEKRFLNHLISLICPLN